MEQEDLYEYGDEHIPVADFKLTQEIDFCVNDADYLKKEIGKLKAQLTKKEAELTDLTDRRIPDLMKRAGLKIVGTPSGMYVELDTKLFANIPSPSGIAKEKDPNKRQEMIQRRQEAIKWLEENNHSDLVKREFIIEFQKGEQEWADKFRADLKKSDRPLHVVEGEDVNHNSLCKLFRELREQGAEFPEKTFGVFDKAVAKISKGKP